MMQQDPILEALSRIESQNKQIIKNQDDLESRIDAIHRDCRRTSIIAGAAGGVASATLVTTAIEFIRIKFGG